MCEQPDPERAWKRDDLVVVSIVLAMAAVVIATVAVGFGMRAIDESKNGRADVQDAAPKAASAGSLELSAESISFSATTLTAPAGKVTIQFQNRDQGVPHNLHVTGGSVDEQTDIEAGPVQQQLTLDVGAGNYRFVCDVHPQQMNGELTITEATS